MITKNTFKSLLLLALGLSMLNGYGFTSNEDFDIDSVEFIEDEQEWELGFDTALYLPENFDPYSGIISVKAINFVDECDEVDLGFETAGYLPEGFDPYIQ
ncbi:MAG: hypothetical protein AAGJ12_07605 [Bacteroidota bacterium]